MSPSNLHIKKSVFDFFPPPVFLAMPAVGLDISDHSIRCIEFKKAHHGLEVGKYSERYIPSGIIEGGYISNPGELTKILDEMRREFGLKFIKASLPEEKAYLFKTEIPVVSPAEIRDSIEFKIQENVPISPSKAVFDYMVIGNEPGKNHLDVSVAVLPIKVVAAYNDVFSAAGLVPVAYHTESQAIANAVIKKGDTSTVLIINFEDTKVGLFIVNQGVVQFTSTFKVGTDSLTFLIQKHFNVSLEEARKIKRKRKFEKNSENSELFYSLINTLSALKEEITKVENYWMAYTSRNDEQKKGTIEKIILCGEDSMLAGVDNYLAVELGTDIHIANVWTNVLSFDRYVPPLPQLDSINFAAAIGLTL